MLFSVDCRSRARSLSRSSMAVPMAAASERVKAPRIALREATAPVFVHRPMHLSDLDTMG